MAKQIFTNGASCKLGAAITVTTPIASLTLEAGQGAEFPAPTAGDWFVLAAWKADKSAFELFKCTARTGDVVTVDTRAYDGSTANTFATTDLVLCVANAGAFSDMQAALATVEGDIATLQSDVTALELAVPLKADAANGTHTGTTAVQTLNVTVAATAAALSVTATPTSAAHAARKDYVDARLPAGFVSAFAGGTAPSGWLECNGVSIAVASYPDLHAAIGYTYGGSGASFNLPDLRGEFIRGWDHGRGVDSGRAQGSSQADLLKSHNHITVEAGSWPYGSTTPNEVSGATYTAVSQAQAYTSSTGGTETRPRNVAMMYCIKT